MGQFFLRSIELEQFRQYGSPCRIEGLDRGLCVIAGGNEVGKSTLLQALRAAFFDRYKSSSGEGFRPYGAVVSPRVAVSFELDGVDYELRKVFSRLKQGEAILESSVGRRWEGSEAEDQLASLLDFEFSRKGGSRPELQGLAGLLWVAQGRAYEAVELSDHSRRLVQSVFQQEMRELLGGEGGDAVHRQVSERWAEYFGVNGKPRGRYRQLLEQEDSLLEVVAHKRDSLEAYESKVNRLETKQAELMAAQRDDVLGRAERKLVEARTAAQRMQQLQQALQSARVAAELAASEFRALEQAYGTRLKQVEELAVSERDSTRLDQQRAASQAGLEQAAAAAASLAEELVTRQRARAEHEARLAAARDAAQLDSLRAMARRQSEVLAEARRLEVDRRAALAARDSIALEAEQLEQLRTLQSSRDLARAKMETVATAIEYNLQEAVSVRLGGEDLSGEGSALLTSVTELEIAGVGSFAIKPGGVELDQQLRALAGLDREFQSRLAALSLDDIRQGEELLLRRESAAQAAERHSAALGALAPRGLASLEAESGALELKLADLESRLTGAATETLDEEALRAELARLERGIAELEEQQAEQLAQAAGVREQLAALGAEQAGAQREQQRLRSSLESGRAEASDDELRTRHAAARQGELVAAEQLQLAGDALAAENPEALEADLQRASRARDDIAAELARLKTDVRDLRVELGALGQSGVSEELAAAEAELAALRLELEATARQARALDLLKRTLDESLSEARQATARPISEKLLPYLRQLIPDAQPVVDENMVLAGIEREGTHEPFGELSIGTREQLAVLVRLAYADLLSESGLPVCVILDDALVNSDEERRERMKAILFRAAQRYQIIVLTCHGRDYRDAGGQFIRLDEL